MQTCAETTTDELMEQFATDNEYWVADINEKGFAGPMREALKDVGPALGGQRPWLCIGGVARDVTPSPEGAAASYDYPYSYDLTVVTQHLVINSWGVDPGRRQGVGS